MAANTIVPAVVAENLWTAQEWRRAARKAAGLNPHDARRVDVVAGTAAPKVVGEGYYWTTPSGNTIVHHPSAYGWRTLYWSSSRRVEVGAEWRPSL